MDRYFYDTLVDVTGVRRSFRLRFLSWLTPTPNLSVYLDITPEKAFARKNEYSVAYLNQRRLSYHKLISQLPGILVFSTEQDLDTTRLNLPPRFGKEWWRIDDDGARAVLRFDHPATVAGWSA